jgi:hypothetical protein
MAPHHSQPGTLNHFNSPSWPEMVDGPANAPGTRQIVN